MASASLFLTGNIRLLDKVCELMDIGICKIQT